MPEPERGANTHQDLEENQIVDFSVSDVYRPTRACAPEKAFHIYANSSGKYFLAFAYTLLG
jgi:hypothetical protein